MADTAPSEGRIVTFYSYKGGTGRSMAVANVAWILALSRFKVLVIDWDLEAPGLHRYFRPFLSDVDLAESDGVIDFVTHFVEAASAQPSDQKDPEWYKPYSNLLPYAKELDYDFPGDGTLDFIPAGRQNSAYAVRVNSFNWKHFVEKLNGDQVLNEACRILKEEYDYILIDSRTGVSDTAGICTVQMPDDLVVCFTLNLQSVMGASAVAASVKELRAQQSKAIRVFPVPMRVEINEQTKTSNMKAFAKPRFVTLLPAEMSEQQKDKYWGECDVTYIPFYAFEENLAYFRDNLDSKTTVLSAMTLLAGRLTPSEIIGLPPLDPGVQTRTIAAYDAFAGAGAVTTSEAPKTKTAVYLSADRDSNTSSLRAELEGPEFEILTRERFEKARAAVFLLAIGLAGLTPSQSADLAVAERVRSGPVYIVLLPGAQPETLPRLLLPYGVIDVRADGKFALPDPAKAATLRRLPVSPYPGLNPFTATDGPMFVARGALIGRLMEAVTRSKFVALIGSPSSGRRSLVQAGLIPRLTAPESPNSPWDVRFSWPSTTETAGRLLVVMDANALVVAAVQPLPDNICLLAIAETPDQVALGERRLGLSAERIDVPPLSDSELMAAIIEPATRAGLQVEAGLPERIVADLRTEKAQLPLLQYLMSQLYDADRRGELTLEKYNRLGGPQMVERECESAFPRPSLSSLSRLVSVAEGGVIAVQDALEANMRDEDRAMVNAFISAGVLAREGGSVRFSNRIFLDRWPRLRQWVNDNRDFLLWRQRLDQSLAAWQVNPRPFTLLAGDALAEARRQAESRHEDLNERELAYIEASVKNAQPVAAAPSAARPAAKMRYGLWLIAAVVLVAGFGAYRLLPHRSGGWCYQQAAKGGGYEAYCFEQQQDCEAAASSPTASSCRSIDKLNLETWGGVKPIEGPKGSSYRTDMKEPLPAPFPQPRVRLDILR